MKYTQFVKQFRDDNKDLNMTFADCMKSEEVKKAFKEFCGCPKIDQKDGNINIILNFGEKEEEEMAAKNDIGPGKRPGTVTPQRVPPMVSFAPPGPDTPPEPMPDVKPPMTRIKREPRTPPQQPPLPMPWQAAESKEEPTPQWYQRQQQPYSQVAYQPPEGRVITYPYYGQPDAIESKEEAPPYARPTYIEDDDAESEPSIPLPVVPYSGPSTIGSEPVPVGGVDFLGDDGDEPDERYQDYMRRLELLGQPDSDAETDPDIPSLIDSNNGQVVVYRGIEENIDDISNEDLTAIALEADPSGSGDADLVVAEGALTQYVPPTPSPMQESADEKKKEKVIDALTKWAGSVKPKKKKREGNEGSIINKAIMAGVSAAVAAVMKANDWSYEKAMDYVLKLENWTRDDGFLDYYFKYYGGMMGGWSEAVHRWWSYLAGQKAGMTDEQASIFSNLIGTVHGGYEQWQNIPPQQKAYMAGLLSSSYLLMKPLLLSSASAMAMLGQSALTGGLAAVDPGLLMTVAYENLDTSAIDNIVNPYFDYVEDYISNTTEDAARLYGETQQQALSWAQQAGQYFYGLADLLDAPGRYMQQQLLADDGFDEDSFGASYGGPMQYGFSPRSPFAPRSPLQLPPQQNIGGTGVINCCPAVRGGKLKASDLRNLLQSSYTGQPVDNWQMEKSMSTNNSKVYRNPSTGQVVVAHKGTQGAQDWGNNLIYAVTGEMGYKQTRRFKEAQRVQKAAENAFGKDMVSTIGHSQGGLQAQMLGKDSKEIITMNKATRPQEMLYGSSKKKNQTDIRTTSDPVSAFRSPFASKKKSINIDADTTDPLKSHSYTNLDKLGDQMIGEGIRDSALAKFENDWKNKLWEGKFNTPGEWDEKKKTWVNVKAYRAALARMEPERKKAYKLLKERLDKDRDAEAKIAIRQKKAQKGRF